VAVPDAAGRLYSSLGKSTWGQWILSNAPDDGQWSSWLSYAASGIKGAVSMIVSSHLPGCGTGILPARNAADPAFLNRAKS
jgi:hypothetical protein